jgi:hypothetical protein
VVREGERRGSGRIKIRIRIKITISKAHGALLSERPAWFNL